MRLEQVKNYLDLTRLHFFFVWPLVFCSGLILSFQNYGPVSNWMILKSALIALFGFEAGFVLNDYVDHEYDRLDVDDILTRYWRPFGVRPVSTEAISLGTTKILFVVFAGTASALILTLPYPNSLYVLGIMTYSYIIERFYQVKKRDQTYPIAQLIGRTDFALFPVAGYLVNGRFDIGILLYLLFFYPYTQAHLGLNDIIDSLNDRARGLATLPILFGEQKTKLWVSTSTLIHLVLLGYFLTRTNSVYLTGFLVGVVFLLVSNILMWRGNTPRQWLRALPFFHLSLLLYTLSIILPYFLN